ncbi:hypothetical protein AWC02_12910 [Mycolicibacter engbaekii]|uniref:Alpha-acetolactate decarboxylase n=1 Tax=Mycolicibacter engbaekii TaxID=188915 RepID=A0A1X1TLX8_9MYCO|nr:acetolactate decarboxylase [Mycolicibacter engbaekii]ORV45478.1 hypothetical protein AWC02_12910 [Mycolicibacter engbaekii]
MTQRDHTLHCTLPASLWQALQARIARTGEDLDQAVRACLGEALDMPQHSIFQVSTSGALVKGVYAGVTRIADVRARGDIGLGTFAGLDGEGLMLDGHCYRAGPHGQVSEVADELTVPFWLTARFRSDIAGIFEHVTGWADLQARLAQLRTTDNLIAAVLITGHFELVHARVACKTAPGTGLVAATSHQEEFTWHNVDGTLIGFWTPDYASTIGVPGLHLHFLSRDRAFGGHVIDLQADRVEAQLHLTTDLHLVLPENAEFLKADLRGDPSAALAEAEGARPPTDSG